MRILVGLDTSDVGERAATAIAPWARSLALEVHFLAVVHPDEIHGTAEHQSFAAVLQPEDTEPGHIPAIGTGLYGEVGANPGDPGPMTVEYRGQALHRARSEREDYLRQVAKRLLPGTDATVHVEFSEHTAEAIVDTARALGVEAIVLATHGRGGITRALMGSVAEQVVRRSPIPVILVGPQFETPPTPRQGA